VSVVVELPTGTVLVLVLVNVVVELPFTLVVV